MIQGIEQSRAQLSKNGKPERSRKNVLDHRMFFLLLVTWLECSWCLYLGLGSPATFGTVCGVYRRQVDAGRPAVRTLCRRSRGTNR